MEGKILSSDLKPNQWFTYYAAKFKTVEINSTFCNFPKKSSIKRFKDVQKEFPLFHRQIFHAWKYICLYIPNLAL